jgi:hypothetical protein
LTSRDTSREVLDVDAVLSSRYAGTITSGVETSVRTPGSSGRHASENLRSTARALTSRARSSVKPYGCRITMRIGSRFSRLRSTWAALGTTNVKRLSDGKP